MQYKLVFVQIPPLYRPIKALQSGFGQVWVTAFKESTQQGMQAQGHNLKVMIKLTIIIIMNYICSEN